MNRSKILIVDDDRNIQSMLQICLAGDYDMSNANDGRVALDMIGWLHPQLLLLDLAMPVIDGMTVLTTLFNSGIRSIPKIIVMTANGSVRMAVQAIRLGASDFLEKPFTPEDVRLSVASVLEEARRVPSDPFASYEEVLSAVRNALKSGLIVDAERLLMKAGAITDADPCFLNLAGAVHEAHGRRISARRFYEKALLAEPDYEPAKRNMNRLEEIERTGVAPFRITLGDEADVMFRAQIERQRTGVES